MRRSDWPSNSIVPSVADLAGDRLQQRALARAIRADHRDDLPARHLQRHALQRAQSAIGGGDILKPQHSDRRDRRGSRRDCAPRPAARRWSARGRDPAPRRDRTSGSSTSITCSTIITVMPRARTSRISCTPDCASTGVRPVSISSSSSSRGSVASARATSSRRFSAGVSECAKVSARAARPVNASVSSARAIARRVRDRRA